MDFISLADSSHRFLRSLVEDDDFARIDNEPKLLGGTATLAPESIPTEFMSDSGGSSTTTQPLLSPTAEAELFLLATNFLLYVALVIVTTMVTKIYFPECLKRREEGAMPRSFSYHRTRTENEEGDDDDEESECLDSGDEEEEAADEALLAKQSAMHKSSMSFEFNQESMSKTEVLKRLVFCVLMLNATFVTWGVMQERMLTRRYPRWTGEYFTYSYFLVFTNRFWTLIMSGLLLLYLKPRRSRSTVIYEYSFPSISNMMSSWCQYEALRYVSFPATTLFKAFKLAPVMAMGKLLGNKSYPQYDYVVALLIGVGISIFMSSTDNLQFGYDIYGEASPTWTGVMLLFFYLFFDSFTSQWQSRMFQRHRDLSMVELMFATSAFSTVLSFVTLVHDRELSPALSFVYRHSEIHLHFFLFSCCSTIGQVCIYYTIRNFGAVVFTIIMTTRILLSIALSCILYGHEVTGIGFLGLMMVLGAVLYRIKRKAEGKHLLTWKGVEDDKAQDMVHEWHEHLDM